MALCPLILPIIPINNLLNAIFISYKNIVVSYKKDSDMNYRVVN
jgi:hypothetical protein